MCLCGRPAGIYKSEYFDVNACKCCDLFFLSQQPVETLVEQRQYVSKKRQDTEIVHDIGIIGGGIVGLAVVGTFKWKCPGEVRF